MPNLTLTLTITDEAMLDWIHNQISSGNFSSGTELFHAGLSLLREEAEFEQEMQMVAERYDEAYRDPDSLIPIEQVSQRLEERHRLRAG